MVVARMQRQADPLSSPASQQGRIDELGSDPVSQRRAWVSSGPHRHTCSHVWSHTHTHTLSHAGHHVYTQKHLLDWQLSRFPTAGLFGESEKSELSGLWVLRGGMGFTYFKAPVHTRHENTPLVFRSPECSILAGESLLR